MKINNKAFTLTEILVGIVIGVIAVAAAFSAYNYYSKSYASVSQKANVNKVARDALALIAKDLRNAGHINKNFVGNSWEGISSQRQAELKLIEVKGRRYGKWNLADQLGIWYTISPKDRKRIFYRLMKYQNENNYYLARDVVINPGGGRTITTSDNEMLVPYIEDFQVILKDKDGNILTPVCYYCGNLETSQGSGQLINTSVGQKTKGQANMKLVHTADVYLTVRSPKDVYKKNRRINFRSGESNHGSNVTIVADKYYRETFFASVHTRNLAIPQVPVTNTAGSVGEGQGYNR